MSAPDDVLRLGRARHRCWRGWKSAIRRWLRRSTTAPPRLDRSGATERRTRSAWSFWTIAATVSLVLVAVFGVPALAERAGPADPAIGRAAARRRRRRAGARHARHQQVGASLRMRLRRRRKGRPRRARQAAWTACRRAAGCRFRSRPRSCAAARPMPLRCPAATSTCSQGLIDKAEEPGRTRRRRSRTRSAMSPIATARARCCRRRACRFCSACCSAISPAAAWW